MNGFCRNHHYALALFWPDALHTRSTPNAMTGFYRLSGKKFLALMG